MQIHILNGCHLRTFSRYIEKKWKEWVSERQIPNQSKNGTLLKLVYKCIRVFRVCQFVEIFVIVVAAFATTIAIIRIRICAFRFSFFFLPLMSSCEYKIQLIAKSIDFIQISQIQFLHHLFRLLPFRNVLLFIQIWKYIAMSKSTNRPPHSFFLHQITQFIRRA